MQRWKDAKIKRTMFRRTGLAASAVAVCLAVAGPAAASATAPCLATTDPFGLYGDEIRFDVLRNGDPVGSHTVRFARAGETITTATRFEVAVDVLFFTAYRYVYASEATWRDGCLVGLTAAVDDNGKESVVRVGRSGEGLTVFGPGGTVEAGRNTLPTEHWAYAVVGQDGVINTITGRVNRVDIAPVASETVKTADGGAISARRYAYQGELDNEVWYDAEGRWVKMRFPAKDGSTIEYVCVKCGVDPSGSRS